MELGAARFAALARELSSYGDRAATARVIAERAVETLGCAWAGIARAAGGAYAFEAVTPSAGVLEAVERIARDTGQGPTLTALDERTTVLVGDLATEARWSQYCAQVRQDTPVRAALVYHLALEDQPLGALAFFDHRPGWFTAERVQLASVFADHATVALAKAANHDHAANLAVALQSSRVIAEAIGILMSTFKVDEQSAFDMLRLVSQHTNRKMREVAHHVTVTGALPDDGSTATVSPSSGQGAAGTSQTP